MKLSILTVLTVTFTLLRVHGHIVAWHKGMYCLNGTTGTDNQNTNEAVNPLYQLPFQDWWFHHVNHCDEFPPAPGDFLDLPVNGQITVELAMNRASTTLSYNGQYTGIFGDGQNHPGLGVTPPGQVPSCITQPNIHTQNESMAAGTAFAISYNSELSAVTPENLVVFSVLYNTPWERIATYSIPNLPACPPAGCICAWGWVPNGCGEPNMYMFPYKCRVTGTPGNAAVAPPIPPTWCEGNQSSCTKGARQMIFWNQLERNNIDVSGSDLSGNPKSPVYNSKLGFSNGAQTDIFLSPGSATQTSTTPSSTGSGAQSFRLDIWRAHLYALFLCFCTGCFVSLCLAVVV
ncbi:hypothetical protein L208DRAFT_1403170 [Tricholoma matsutake]|nr:hypothetical protein L208DRAFT_1403170 [Tricholoma matsutake 945]